MKSRVVRETETAPEPKMRADGARNREAILLAAEEVFVNMGFDAPLEVIASRAGVSRMTLYRNFPDRESLGFAVFDKRMSQLEAIAAEMQKRDDGFFATLEVMSDMMANSTGFSEAFFQRTPQPSRMGELSARTTRLLNALLRQGQERGVLREDLKPTDVALIQQMMAGVRGGDPAKRRSLMRRALSLLRSGVERS